MISLIVAIGEDNLIGKGNDLPWNYPADLAYFKKTTKGHDVIMGDKTFLSIVSRLGHPLKNRKNIVATIDPNFKVEKEYNGEKYDIEIIRDFISYLKNDNSDDEKFVIGGKQIYALSLDYVTKMYITHVHKHYEGDVFFPKIDYSKFKKISKEISGDLEFAVYERVKK